MNNDIDKLLKNWDKHSSPRGKTPEAMLEDISKVTENMAPYHFEPDYRLIHRNWIYGAVAAMIILSATICYLFNELHSIDKTNSSGGINRTELAEIKRINEELKVLFPKSLKSFCIVNGSLVINTQENTDDAGVEDNPKRLLVRYAVMKKVNGKWITAAKNDIVTTVGSNTRLANNGLSPKGYIWSWKVDKRVVALESNIKIKLDQQKIPVKFFGGMTLNKPEIVKIDENLKISQTVTLI